MLDSKLFFYYSNKFHTDVCITEIENNIHCYMNMNVYINFSLIWPTSMTDNRNVHLYYTQLDYNIKYK